jgi:uracil-DNA glycosylase
MNASEVPADIATVLAARLRKAASRSSVPGSLPVLFFGDLPAARIATVGLNPSKQEYLDQSGGQLQGSRRRFETLTSVGAASRETLSDHQIDRALRTMRSYFHPGMPVYSWFSHLDRVLKPLGASYGTGSAAHLDLVQEATNPTWSQLVKEQPLEAEALLQSDLPFLQWEIESFGLSLLVCNGTTAFNNVVRLLKGEVFETGKLKRITWWVAAASIGPRILRISGWNIPLVRATGLGTSGELQLGELIGQAATWAGLRP